MKMINVQIDIPKALAPFTVMQDEDEHAHIC